MNAGGSPRRRPLTSRQREVLQAGGQFLQHPPLAMAHRGGAVYGPNVGNENSLLAFANAIDLGYRYIETDVRVSADGEAFCFHDPDLERVVGLRRPFAELTARQIRSLRLRGGEPIPSLAEAFEAFPHVRFNLDAKVDAAVDAVIDVLDRFDAYHRVLVGSFSAERLRRLRTRRPQAATSTSPAESMAFRWGVGPMVTRGIRAGALCLQVPLRFRGRKVVTERAVRAAHRQNLQVHIWTIDDAETMHRLLDIGADGIITDRPDVLKRVLVERGQWAQAAGDTAE